MVAEATSALCEAANAAVQGNASQEKLIASCQAVSASTAQLLLACRVKACLLYTSPSPRDKRQSRMPSSA